VGSRWCALGGFFFLFFSHPMFQGFVDGSWVMGVLCMYHVVVCMLWSLLNLLCLFGNFWFCFYVTVWMWSTNVVIIGLN